MQTASGLYVPEQSTLLIPPPPKWPYSPHFIQYEALRYFGLIPNDPPPGLEKVNILLYAGQGGGGKSHLARILASTLASLWPGSIGAIFRRVTDDIRKTQILPFREEVPEEYGYYNDTEKTFFWKNGGSQTRFHHCVEDDSHKSYRSHLWDYLVIEESTEFTWDQITFFWSRVVSRSPDRWPIILMTTNSIGVSHMEHKTFFISGHKGWDTWTTPPRKLPDGTMSKPRRIGWIPIKTSDNPSVDLAEIKAGQYDIADPEMRKSMAEGSWELNAGQFFSPFRRSLHVVTHHHPENDWRCWRGIDWGYSAPAGCLWAARDPAKPYPNVYIYREWMERGVPTQLQAKRILALSSYDPPINLTLADPNIWGSKMGKGIGTTMDQEYKTGGLQITKAINKREVGWARIQRALAGTDTVPPELSISEECVQLISQLETARRNPHNMEDIVDAENADGWRDELLDCLRYLLMGARPITVKKARRSWGIGGDNDDNY